MLLSRVASIRIRSAVQQSSKISTSRAWNDINAAHDAKMEDKTTGVTMIASADNTATLHSFMQRVLSAASHSPPLTLDEFASLEHLAHDAPDVLFQLLHDTVDVDHADLSDVLPLLPRRTRGLVEVRSSFDCAARDVELHSLVEHRGLLTDSSRCVEASISFRMARVRFN
jgi:hypothetical protein